MQLECLCAAKLYPALSQQPEGAATHTRNPQVKLDRGLDFSGLDDVLVDMKLAPQVLELPCPAYFREERSKVCFSIYMCCTCASVLTGIHANMTVANSLSMHKLLSTL